MEHVTMVTVTFNDSDYYALPFATNLGSENSEVLVFKEDILARGHKRDISELTVIELFFELCAQST